jgi:hypothetical protein
MPHSRLLSSRAQAISHGHDLYPIPLSFARRDLCGAYKQLPSISIVANLAIVTHTRAA